MRVLATAGNLAVLLVLLTTGILGLVGCLGKRGLRVGYPTGPRGGDAVALCSLGRGGLFRRSVQDSLGRLGPGAAGGCGQQHGGVGIGRLGWHGPGFGLGGCRGGPVLFTGLIVWAGSRAVAPARTGERDESSGWSGVVLLAGEGARG